MGLQDPVAVYQATTNIEAQLIKLWLVESGIEACVLEDLSTAGSWLFGVLPEIHKPQVWVSKSDVERVRPMIEQFETELAERNRVKKQIRSDVGPPIDIVCDECHQPSVFAANQRGTIQECSHCGAFVDVGEVDETDAFWLESDPADEPGEA
ncbi:MAG TPA: DUF2007 domain-containing protein [Pirellulales bacterium]|jgi:hypothetical protein|nr:DUF2007 domain-containing protein [Pirellulales bacterium]